MAQIKWENRISIGEDEFWQLEGEFCFAQVRRGSGSHVGVDTGISCKWIVQEVGSRKILSEGAIRHSSWDPKMIDREFKSAKSIARNTFNIFEKFYEYDPP